MSDAAKGASGQGAAEYETPLLEWLAGALGALLFFGALAVLVAEGLSPTMPPQIEGRIVETQAWRGGWLVTFEAENTGDEPAEAVKLVLSLGEEMERGGERREVMIDFIGPHSIRRAGAFFTTDPGGRDLKIEPQGYLAP